jgi:AcrR family transcriptional regulator
MAHVKSVVTKPVKRRRGRPPHRPDADTAASTSATRRQLVEVAGQVFAEKGFDRATGKEICKRAHVNAAAINYHFGGIDGLYTAVLEEAHGRIFSYAQMAAAVAGKADGLAKLRAITEVVVRTALGPVTSSWVMRVLGREIIAPSAALERLRSAEFIPKTRLLRGIISEVMGLAHDRPAVSRACLSVMAPCFMLLICEHRMLHDAFPALRDRPEHAAEMVEHLLTFALAGLRAVAAAEVGKGSKRS